MATDYLPPKRHHAQGLKRSKGARKGIKTLHDVHPVNHRKMKIMPHELCTILVAKQPQSLVWLVPTYPEARRGTSDGFSTLGKSLQELFVRKAYAGV